MLVSWNETDSWNSVGGGIQADGSEALALPVATLPDVLGGSPGSVRFLIDVTETVQTWAAGAPNHGWVFKGSPNGTNGFQFSSSEEEIAAARPMLIIVPEPATLMCLTALGAWCLRRRRN